VGGEELNAKDQGGKGKGSYKSSRSQSWKFWLTKKEECSSHDVTCRGGVGVGKGGRALFGRFEGVDPAILIPYNCVKEDGEKGKLRQAAERWGWPEAKVLSCEKRIKG